MYFSGPGGGWNEVLHIQTFKSLRSLKLDSCNEWHCQKGLQGERIAPSCVLHCYLDSLDSDDIVYSVL